MLTGMKATQNSIRHVTNSQSPYGTIGVLVATIALGDVEAIQSEWVN